MADKIAEREALAEKQRAERAPLTEEEKLEEKLRVQELEEKANLQLTRDMCGKVPYSVFIPCIDLKWPLALTNIVSNTVFDYDVFFRSTGIKTGSIDNLVPESKEDFELLGKAIVEKIQLFSTSQHYNDLIEDVANKICVDRKYLIFMVQVVVGWGGG